MVEEAMKLSRMFCPYYGFALVREVMMDSKGNQCALHGESFSPCVMQLAGLEPEFMACTEFAEAEREMYLERELLGHVAVFINGGFGMPFERWLDVCRKAASGNGGEGERPVAEPRKFLEHLAEIEERLRLVSGTLLTITRCRACGGSGIEKWKKEPVRCDGCLGRGFVNPAEDVIRDDELEDAIRAAKGEER